MIEDGEVQRLRGAGELARRAAVRIARSSIAGGMVVRQHDPGAATADAAVAGVLEDADHWTSESSRTYVDVVTYTTYDADDRPLVVVEAEHRVPKGWFVGRTTTCD